MELECAKYKEKMDSDRASCAHPGDYCKYRTSCIIHFMGGEKKNGDRAVDDAKAEENAAPDERRESP